MLVNILLPFKEKFSESSASSVSITVSNNLNYSSLKNKVRVYGTYVDQPMYKDNFIGIKKSLNFFKSKNLHLAHQMCKYIRKTNLDKQIIEIHNRPYLVYEVKKKLCQDIIITLFLHNDPQQMKGSKTKLERLKLLNDLDKIYCVSEFIKKKFLTGIKDKHNKVVVLYNGVERKINYFPKKERNIIFVGRLVKEKGVDIYVEVIQNIYSKYKDWNYSLIGSTKLGNNNLNIFSKDILKKFDRIGSRTKITGFISQKELQKIMQSASVIIIPSIWEEPFGLVAAEAMANGVAIISSKVGGLTEIIRDNGILIENVNVIEFTNHLETILNSEKKLNCLQQLSWKNFCLSSKNISKQLDKHRIILFSKN